MKLAKEHSYWSLRKPVAKDWYEHTSILESSKLSPVVSELNYSRYIPSDNYVDMALRTDSPITDGNNIQRPLYNT